jgi:hypothetical protein
MAIGKPRWGGLRTDPYNPDSPDADNDGIVQEGTLFERPAGTRIVSTLTGLELDLGTPGNSLQDVGNTQIVDREGRPVSYRQSWSSGTLSAGERNGTIGNSNGTVGSSLGNLDGPPTAPKPDPVRLRSTDVDKNGKPLRVFVSDDRRFHGVMPQDWAGFDNPAWREAGAHWGGSLRDGEMPISANDPRLPDTLFYVTRNPSAQRDLGVVRTDGDRVDLFYSRGDADAALAAARADDPGAGILSLDTDNIRTGAAVTLRDGRVSVFGDVRLDADSAPEPVRREADIPTPESLNPIKDRFDAEGFELYLVGGAVRDTLMGRDIKDYDLASDATPDQIEAMLADVDGARLDLTGKDFAVVRVNMPDGEEYEIATFRRDVGEGRRPDEVEFTTIDEDVRRRDLTMNALFYDLSTNEIVDYVGGIDDIENGVVRAVGDPGERFREDPLRILRAFRFSGRTGWGMDSATVDAIRSNSALRGVSGERVHDEFVRGIDSAVSPSGYIQQIDLVDNGTGAVWGQVFPGLNVSPSRLPADGSYDNRAVLVASLLADNDIDSVKAVLKDRKFTNDEITDVELIMQARNINDGNVAALKNKFGKNRRVSADDMRAFHGVQPDTEDEIEPFLQFADAPPALTAADLQARDIKPGPQFGAMLREAEEQRYREIRDGFSVGGDKPEPVRRPTSAAGQAPRSSEFPVFNNATAILEDMSEERPVLSSNVDKAADSLFDRADQHPGYIYRTPQQMQDLRDSAQGALDNLISYYDENPDPDVDLDDPETEMGHYAAALRMHIDLLDEQFEADNAEYLDGYFDQITANYDPTDKKLTDEIKAVIDSDEFQNDIKQSLDLLNPELRSTSDIRIATSSRGGGSVNTYGGAFSFGDHTITMHPTLYADLFRDNGVPFDDFIAWADQDGTLTDLERLNLRFFWDGEDKPDLRFSDTSLGTARERVLIHENFHGLHSLLTNGRFDDDPEWLALREQFMKDLKESGFFDELTPLGDLDADDPANYFNYLMSWTDHLGMRETVVGDWSEEDKANPDLIAETAGMEWFAEALAWISEGREFPGSDVIVDFVNAKLDLNLTQADRTQIELGE